MIKRMNSEHSTAPDLFAPLPAGFVGIARLAQQSAHLDDGHDVEYFELPSRSLLNRCTSKRMPFTWTINPFTTLSQFHKASIIQYTGWPERLGCLDPPEQIQPNFG